VGDSTFGRGAGLTPACVGGVVAAASQVHKRNEYTVTAFLKLTRSAKAGTIVPVSGFTRKMALAAPASS